MVLSEHELILLEHIAKNSDDIHQRDLARIAGVSLGMTNAIVKRLVKKGGGEDPEGKQQEHSLRRVCRRHRPERGYRYLRRTIRNIIYYRKAIEAFVQGLKTQGYSRLLIVGRSDLGFIVEFEDFVPLADHKSQKRAVAYLQDVVNAGRSDTSDISQPL